MSQTIEISRMAGMYARKRRLELALTQREVADRAGVSERTVYSFELGERPGIQLDKVLAIYSAIGLALTVETVDPAGSGRPRTAAEIAEDFLAHLG